MTRAPTIIRKKPTGTPRRRTQAERSSSTRVSICQATLEALADVGHEQISTSMIADLAEVSRGALTHQFPTRNDIFVAALRHLHDKWQIMEPCCSDPATVRYTLTELTETLWRNIFTDRHYLASIELMLAARQDNDLGRRLREEMKRWVDWRDERMAQLVGLDPQNPADTLQLHLILSVLRGIAVHKSFDQDTATGIDQVQLWKEILERISRENR